jgi:hypothetical protein
MTRRIVLAVLVCSLQIALFGQADRGTITGTITDSTGAVVPSVEVKARNVNTGVETMAVTNEAGVYQLSNLPVGTYQISARAQGFNIYERTGFQLTVAQTARLDISLTVGALTETISVVANAELLNSANAMVSTTLETKVITDMPLSFGTEGRLVESFAFAVTPGVEGNAWTAYMGGGQTFSKEVLIDGISATSQIQGHIMETSPTMEAVQEFTVQTSGMSAEYGRSSGGFFNFALKSGTNQLHGSGFYYGRNEALNGNTWLNNWYLGSYGGLQSCEAAYSPDPCPYRRSTDRQHLFGASIGGPVVIPKLYNGRDRTFLFGAFEQYEQEKMALGALNQTVPIPAFLNGDFSALLGESVGADALGRQVLAGQIYDPKTLRRLPEGAWVSDPFEGNIIPRERFSKVASRIVEIYRMPQYQSMSPDRLVDNFRGALNQQPWFHKSELTLKADHNFSSNNHLSGSFIFSQRPRIWGGGVWVPSFGPAGGPLAGNDKQEVTGRRLSVSDNWTLKPNLINTLTLAYNRYRNPGKSLNKAGDWANKLGITGTSDKNFPHIEFGDAVNGIGTTSIGGGGGEGFYVSNVYILSDAINWVRGRHSFKFGGEVWHMQNNGHPSHVDTLEFNFANTTTGMPGYGFSNRIGLGFASFLLGEVDSAERAVPFDSYARRNYVALYLQDDYKVTSKLTLNLGLRWEQPQALTEKYNVWSNFNPNLTNTELGVKGALEFASPDRRTFDGGKEWHDFSPRVGFAYSLGTKSVIRGGYGMFYSPIGLQYWYGIPYQQWGAHGYVGEDRFATTGNLPVFNWDQGYPGHFVAPTKDPNFLTWGMVAIDENSLKPGYTHQYNVSFQHSLTQNDLLQVAFMGNDGRRLHDGKLRRNQPRKADWENPNVDPYAWIWDADSAAAAGVPYPYAGFSGMAGFALAPFPQVANTWGGLLYVDSPLGSSSYRSMQLSYTRRMSQGFSANVSYNLSKSKGNTETNFQDTWGDCDAKLVCSPYVQDMYDLKEAADTVMSFDQTHIFKGLVMYELPFGRGRKWLSSTHRAVDAILGGWTISSVFRYASGFPLSIVPNVWYPGWDGSVYADVNPNADLSVKWNPKGFDLQNIAGNTYFSADAFSNPKDHKLGNGKRLYDNLRGFGTANEDFGIMKYWGLREKAKLQFRAELVNAFNRHYYRDPEVSLGNSDTFGKVTTTVGDPRVVQFGLRVAW